LKVGRGAMEFKVIGLWTDSESELRAIGQFH